MFILDLSSPNPLGFFCTLYFNMPLGRVKYNALVSFFLLFFFEKCKGRSPDESVTNPLTSVSFCLLYIYLNICTRAVSVFMSFLRRMTVLDFSIVTSVIGGLGFLIAETCRFHYLSNLLLFCYWVSPLSAEKG